MEEHCKRVPTLKDMEGSQHKLFTNKFDDLVEVCRVAVRLYEDQEKQDSNVSRFDICCSVPDKSCGKRVVSSHDQESDKAPVFSSRTCSILREELFRWGRKTSSSSRYYGFGDVRGSQGDRVQVLGKKRMYYGPEDFEYYDREEKVLGKKRKFYGPEDEDYEYSEKKEKKKRRNNVKVRNRVAETAPLPVEFADEIQRLGGNDVRLLIQKNISGTDLDRSQNRFNMPYNQIREEAKDFLTEAENKTLDQRKEDNGIVSMEVPLLEPNLNRSYIDFKKWPMSKSFWYVLCNSWTVMQKNNHLEADTDIQVWSFRVNGELNLALVKVPQV